MKQVRITRIATCSKYGTLGVILVDSQPIGVTLERPDRGNKRDISCIPTGQYVIERIKSAKYGTTFRVCDVVDRSGILFHSGNTVKDTSGCILLGTSFGKNATNIQGSLVAFKRFIDKMHGNDLATLTILEVF